MKKALLCAFLLCLPVLSFGQAPQERDRVVAGDGTSAAPSFAFSAARGSGLYKRRDGDGQGVLFAAGGKRGVVAVTSGSLALASTHQLIWSSIPNVDNLTFATNDIRLGRVAPGVLSLRSSGGSAPTLALDNVYPDFDNSSERFAIRSTESALILRTEASGKGKLRPLEVGTGKNAAWVFDSDGNFGRGDLAPNAAACGAKATVQGRDSAMIVTLGDGEATSKCTVNFGTAWNGEPSCVANSDRDYGPLTVSTSAGAVTVTKASAFTPRSKLHIHCAGV